MSPNETQGHLSRATIGPSSSVPPPGYYAVSCNDRSPIFPVSIQSPHDSNRPCGNTVRYSGPHLLERVDPTSLLLVSCY